MKRIFFLLTLFISVSAFSVSAQDFKVPEGYKMKKKSDYEKYEKDVLAAIDWLQRTPIVEQQNKRKDVNGFLLVWMTGTPKVSMELKGYVLKFAEPDADAMIMFMAGWSKFALENPKQAKDKAAGEMAGVRMVIKVFRDNMGYSKNETIEAAAKAEEKGELEKWIKENADAK